MISICGVECHDYDLICAVYRVQHVVRMHIFSVLKLGPLDRAPPYKTLWLFASLGPHVRTWIQPPPAAGDMSELGTRLQPILDQICPNLDLGLDTYDKRGVLLGEVRLHSYQ